MHAMLENPAFLHGSSEGQFNFLHLLLLSSVPQSGLTLGDPKDCSMPGPPVPHRFRSSPKFKFWSPAEGIFLMIACTTRGKGKPKDKVCGIPYFSRCSLDWSMPPPSASRLVSLVRLRVSSGMLPSCPVAQVVVIGN